MADADHVTEGGLKKLAERIRTDVSTKITKPATPSSTQMLTMNSAGVVALATIPAGGSGGSSAGMVAAAPTGDAAVDTPVLVDAITNGKLLQSGTYSYDGPGIDAPTYTIRGVANGETAILIAAGKTLLVCTQMLYNATILDCHFIGGKGVLLQSYTGANVTAHHTIERCKFESYTGCAIQSDNGDMPYWTITHSQFYGANSTSCVGVALAGGTDLDYIAHNSFVRNRCHVKIGKGGNHCKVFGNDFIQYDTGSNRCSVWVVCHDSFNNSGPGLTISENKFGNENQATNDYRILFASSATPASGAHYGETFWDAANTSGYANGSLIQGNGVIGIGDAHQPFIVTKTNAFTGHFIVWNRFAGGLPPRILDVASPGGWNTQCRIGPGVMSTDGSVVIPLTNLASGNYVAMA